MVDKKDQPGQQLRLSIRLRYKRLQLMNKREFLHSPLWINVAAKHHLTETDLDTILASNKSLREDLAANGYGRGPKVRMEIILKHRHTLLERFGVGDWQLRKDAQAFDYGDIFEALDKGSTDNRLNDLLFIASIADSLGI